MLDVDTNEPQTHQAIESPALVCVGIDPGATSGVAVWSILPTERPVRWELVKLTRARWSQQDAIDLLNRLIGDAVWMAAVERPPPPKAGIREAPTHADRYWRDVLKLLVHQRASRAGKKRPGQPTVLRPRPDDWRRPLGIRARGIGASSEERRADLKLVAVERLKLVHRLHVDQHDLAEALSIAEWAARNAKRGFEPPARGKPPKEIRWAL